MDKVGPGRDGRGGVYVIAGEPVVVVAEAVLRVLRALAAPSTWAAGET